MVAVAATEMLVAGSAAMRGVVLAAVVVAVAALALVSCAAAVVAEIMADC
eukprot:CAMPEP_0115100278 /NCGR_PEP_ID=MMETSP0227-20121206/32449_1 /TAXON_ID=89957 /ORGANISM="Polarella glacialis, Strain CCMP 1383" /LENGTH=49 /DNA_ID=CAMNT_0002495623 /DNA_START=20 /DNA_END=169 /DNA_ORIENTATION=-